MTTTQIDTVAELKRRLTPGTLIQIRNHRFPHLTRTTKVEPCTNTVELGTKAVRADGTEVISHLRWPKARDVRPGEHDREVHIDSDGQQFLTITILARGLS